MQHALKAAATALASLDHRQSAESHTRRAWEVVKNAGPLAEVDSRILGHLEARIATCQERQAFQGKLDDYRRHGLPSEEVLEPARSRIAREHGISHDHATDLGYESVGDLTGQH